MFKRKTEECFRGLKTEIPNPDDVVAEFHSLSRSASLQSQIQLLARCSALSGLALAQYRAAQPPVPAVGWLKLLQRFVAGRAAKLPKTMSSGGEATPTAAADSAAPIAPGDTALQPEGVAVDGTAEAGVGPGVGARFDGGRLATVLQGSVADQQVTPASTVAAAMEQPLPAQPEQPGLANAAQFLPFVQLPQQPASVPLQQPASQPAAGDDAAEQQRILQQSAQLQQQQVRDLRFRGLGRHSPMKCHKCGAAALPSACCCPTFFCQDLEPRCGSMRGLGGCWQNWSIAGVIELQPVQCSC